MLLLDSLKYEINKHKVISFDIFDTLLLRPYVKPTDLFLHIEKLKNKQGFTASRIQAEHKARKVHNSQEDITLDDIYNEIDEKYKYLKQFEIDLEAQVLQPNKEILEIFEYAKQQGKKVIITSDMYLSKSTIENILKIKGFEGYYKLYLSNEIGKTKAAGSLYKYIINDLNVDGSDILHIGDSYSSDVEKAKENGIYATYYQKVSEKFLNRVENEKFRILYNENQDNVDISIILGTIILKNHNKDDDNVLNYWEEFGYNIGGAVCYGFTKFAMEEAKKNNISDLFFIARDGYTLNKIYDVIKDNCNAKNHYVYAPRILKILCLLEYGDNEQQLSELFKKFASLSDTFKNLLPESFKSFKEKEEFLTKHKNILQDIANNNKQEYLNYINSLNLNGNNICLVDTVAQGFSAQRLLVEIIKDKNISANYVRVISDYGVKHNYIYSTYFDEAKHLYSWNIMEFIMTAPELPIKDMKNGEIIHQDNPSIFELRRKEVYDIISKSEVEFSKDIKKIFGDYSIEFNCNNIISFVNSFCYNLNTIDEMYFRNIYHAWDANHSIYNSLFDEICVKKKTSSINNNNRTIMLFNKIPLLKIRARDNQRTYKLFSKIPLLKVQYKNSRRWFKLFDIITIMKTQNKNNKQYFKLFGFLPILTIKNK